jgi:hypothetical protein
MYFFHAQHFFAYFFYADCRVIPRLPRPFRPFKLILFHDKNRSHTIREERKEVQFSNMKPVRRKDTHKWQLTWLS